MPWSGRADAEGGLLAKAGDSDGCEWRPIGRMSVRQPRDHGGSKVATTVQQAPGLWRTDLQAHDLSVPGREVIQNRVEIGPEAPYVRHKHPGEEIIYILEGTLQYDIDGQPSITASAG